MRSHARITLLALLTGAIVVISAPVAQASFGVESFFAANCKISTCDASNVTSEAYTQAAGHPPFGITDFKVKTKAAEPEVPEGKLDHIRVDVAPGVSTNPQAVPKCSMEEFGTKEIVAGTGAFPVPTCKPETEIGVNQVLVYVEGLGDVPLEGTVYNLEQPVGRSSEFGVALSLAPLGKAGAFAHTLIEGHVEWASDYHDYFEIPISTALPLVKSRLIFKGNIGEGGFLTNPSNCSGIGPQTTTAVHLESEEGESGSKTYTTPVGTEECNSLVPFAPTFSLHPAITQSDQPDGVTTELALPHDPDPTHLDSSQLKTASVTLPEGMTLNPSAANGLEACAPAQIGIGTRQAVACPGGAKIGTVTLNVPGLPSGSLEGNIYLGGPPSGPITGPPYTIYLDAESVRYGVSVRLEGEVVPNATTGRLTATFSKNPEQPFSDLILRFNGGATAPLANPLVCGTATTETSLSPFTGTAAQSPLSSFVVDSNNAGGACPSPLPFALSQSTQNASPNARANTSYTFNLARTDGQQYLSQVKTVLPPGLVGLIPSVPLCGEAEANAGSCSLASQIGAATVSAGAGPSPYSFYGPAFLTGPYNGAPYGMAIVVPAVAGPFNLGNVITRASIAVDPSTGRVIVTSNVPTIVKGVPLRLKGISVVVNRPGFLINPTNCAALATESTLTSTFGATQSLSSPFQVANCNKLAFKPSFGAASGAKTSKANGASLETTLNMPAGQANVKSVLVQLPKQLPSRLTTLQKACPEATFAANPHICPTGSRVGGVRANTPVLPGKMTGPVYLVSHGGAAFPDLDLVLEANGVSVILVGNTNIKKGITTTNFATVPDVPVSSITVNLPVGGHSALAANGNLCANKLVMPTTIVGQNGVTVKRSTTIKVNNCPVRIVGHKVIGNTAYITVQTFAAGRISGKGANLATVFRGLGKAEKTATLKVPLSRRGQSRRRPLRVSLRVGFVPKKRGAASSAAFVTVTFR
jgi:hypothetical protein